MPPPQPSSRLPGARSGLNHPWGTRCCKSQRRDQSLLPQQEFGLVPPALPQGLQEQDPCSAAVKWLSLCSGKTKQTQPRGSGCLYLGACGRVGAAHSPPKLEQGGP